jgi:predicted oxidoreductase
MTLSSPKHTLSAGGTSPTRAHAHRVSLDAGELSFSRLIYGCWRMADHGQDTRPQTIVSRIEACLERGITTFDHADIYGGYEVERVFGNALRAVPELKKRMEIVTKCGIKLVHPARPAHRLKTYDTRAEHIVCSLENSLALLGVECVDMLLLHRPDPLLDPHEVATAFSKLHKEGKVKAFGVSNFLPHQVETLRAFSPVPIAANQVEFHCLRTAPLSDGTLDQCARLRMLPMAWSPLAGGALVDPAHSDPRVARTRTALARIAQEHDTGVEQVALAWLLAHPSGVAPVIGTQRVERIESLSRAREVVLAQDEWFEILEAAEGREVP